MGTTLHFRGVQADAAGSALDLGEFGNLLNVEPVGEYRLADVRGSANIVQMPMEDDDVVEVALEGGVQLWLAGGTLRELFEATGQQQARDGNLTISPVLPLGTATRGFGRRAITVLRRLVVKDGQAKVAELGAIGIAKRLEDGLLKTKGGEEGAGLYSCVSPMELGDRVDGTMEADAPALVFLHGTASRYDGSFGKLPDSVWQRMRQRYGQRIYALQHRTLTESPISNALALLEQIPANARLHIVSHSRGGLIGELLCRVARTDGLPFDDVERAYFEKAGEGRSKERSAAYKQQAADLARLSDLLQEKKPRIERFVRVACPANGTTLASGRLDLYFSILLNGVKLVLPGANPVVGFLGATIASVIRTRARPEALPGVEAMMPESPLIAVLNRRDVEVKADLTVIAGDMEGKGPLGVLKEIVTDLFYRENHDLVVHTRAMVGGSPRPKGGARVAFKKGDGIDHFHYFEAPDTADKVFLGLSRADDSDAGFSPITKDTAEELRTRAARQVARAKTAPPTNRPVVFLLPGIMGSRLSAGDDAVWVNFINLAKGDFKRLAISATNIKPVGLIDKSYEKLSRFLEDSHRVIEFPYDWRRPLSESADRLALEVERVLNETQQPIRFLAHSMGGLVSRTMVARHRELWRRISARNGARLVMLGTPNRGSWAVPRVLLGHDRLIKILSIVDLRQNQQKLLDTIAGFNGLAEMLPDDAQHDFFGTGWAALDIDRDRPRALPSADVLSAARAARALLAGADALDVERMIYVAGTAPATPLGFRTRGNAIEFMATSQGDGTVPWSLGLLDRIPTYYMDAKHGDMANMSRSFTAIVDLLVNGRTSLLPQEAPAAVRARPELFPMPEDEVVVYPDEDEIESIVLRSDRGQADEEAEEEPLRISVAHGNLAFVTSPLMVGHYDGDTIAGAEKALDQHLSGWLSERRQLDLYPGPLETSGIFLQGGTDSGAIVVGLGEVGALSPSRLERTVTYAVLSYAAKRVEQAEEKGDLDGTIAHSISSLLIGSGQGGMALDDSVRAIINGVLTARQRLRSTAGRHSRVHIAELTFVELFEDAALAAVSALNEFRNDSRVRNHISPADELTSLPGGQRRLRFTEPPGWWNRVEVFENENTGALEFQNLTQRRARAEAFLVPTQRQLIDGFVQDVISSPNPDQTTAHTLFELLVPNTLKDYAPDQNHLMLLVDEASARYPWELMTDRNNGSGEPIAVRSGLVRSLKVEVFRERPQAVMGNHALVVGDPPSDLPELPGAQQEAQTVANLLSRRQFSVVPLHRPSPSTVVNQLFARDYKILHFAAHGVHLEKVTELGEARADGRKTITRRISGIVIGPNNTLLTAGEIRQMRAVPELVFVNCCHLGRTDESVPSADQDPEFLEARQRRLRHQLAANVAAEFIRMGVRAVIAAGWAVDDSAALTFATTFYDAMLSGQPFGEAVRAARKATYDGHRSANTWGAYQCYGDPGYVLMPARDDYSASSQAYSYASRNELIVALENIAHNAETIAQRDLRAEQKRVADIHTWAKDRPESWLGDARVLLTFANAYRELDLFKDAVACYEAAMAADWTALTIRDLEQCANLRVRDAAADYLASDRGQKARETASRFIISGLNDLKSIPAGATEPPAKVPYFKFGSERLALQASAQKRLSLIQSGSESFDSLREMASLYRQAHEAAKREASKKTDTYPTLNWLASAVVLEIFGLLDDAPDWTSELDRVRAIAAARDAASPSFWSKLAEVEALIVRHLIDDSLADSVTKIVGGYQVAWRRGGTPRKLRSALDQLEWYEYMLGQKLAGARPRKPRAAAAPAPAKARNADRRRASAAAIAQIREQVAALMA